MSFIFKCIGGILIIVGTCIGGGLLALPVTDAPGGFLTSLIILIASWIFMNFGAYFTLEITQWFPIGSNFSTMAKETVGRKGVIIAWGGYIFLCYSALCAYASGGSDILQLLLSYIGLSLHFDVTVIIFLLILGFVVYKGISYIDNVNKCFMLAKFICLFILITLLLPKVNSSYLTGLRTAYIMPAISVSVTSFAFSFVVPSLFRYFDGNTKVLKRLILMGTAIPLICYILWNISVMGTLPSTTGEYGLIGILRSGNVTAGLVLGIEHIVHSQVINLVAKIFVAICMVTAFFGTSLAYSDFLFDGLKVKRTRKGRLSIILLTYLPPLIILFFYPQIFILALTYAGIFVTLLMVILPIMILWNGRYKTKISSGYRVIGGKWSAGIVFSLGIVVMIIGILGCIGMIY